jgi:hypothetical protein
VTVGQNLDVNGTFAIGDITISGVKEITGNTDTDHGITDFPSPTGYNKNNMGSV